ncbi:hypothetical protein NC651_032405 [Populus alba x Populus x berolinensis]|nr:hypothetical protein NC651_032405 [Populus alba x Populus x berolinensis]
MLCPLTSLPIFFAVHRNWLNWAQVLTQPSCSLMYSQTWQELIPGVKN